MAEKPWKIEVTILVPREDAPTLDDAIEMVGDRLRPLPWAGLVRAGP